MRYFGNSSRTGLLASMTEEGHALLSRAGVSFPLSIYS
jgi:hypothetical protein